MPTHVFKEVLNPGFQSFRLRKPELDKLLDEQFFLTFVGARFRSKSALQELLDSTFAFANNPSLSCSNAFYDSTIRLFLFKRNNIKKCLVRYNCSFSWNYYNGLRRLSERIFIWSFIWSYICVRLFCFFSHLVEPVFLNYFFTLL